MAATGLAILRWTTSPPANWAAHVKVKGDLPREVLEARFSKESE
jgi:hypothetical protein